MWTVQNKIQTILGDIVRDYNRKWSELATSRVFPEIGGAVSELSLISSLESISAVVLHKDDLDDIDATLLKNIVTHFDVVSDSPELALLCRRGVETGLRPRHYLIAKACEFQALVSARTLLEAYKNEQRRTEDLIEGLKNSLNIRRVFYIGDNTSLTVTRHGMMMYVDTLDVSLSPHLLVSGNWEPGITKFFRSRLKPGMRYLEIGANCGWFTLQAAALVGREGRVVAFEPNKRYADLIRSSLTINGFEGQCKIVEKAVCNRNEELEFSIFRKFRGNSTLLHADSVAERFGDTFEVVNVTGITLDDYFPAGERFDFMKIDAESAEVMILDGGARFFEENQNIELIIEASPYAESSEKARHVSNVLAEMGFSCLRIDSNGDLNPDGLTENGIEIFATRSNPTAYDDFI